MNEKVSFSRGAAALVIAASLVACSSGAQNLAPVGRPADGQSSTTRRHTMSWNLGQTQPIATGQMLIPLTLSVSGTTGQLGVFGNTYCAPPSGANPCPNVNFTASPPQYYSAYDVSFTLQAVTLNANCSAPGTSTPAPGFTAGCYVVAYEGGVGPYVLQGPAASSNGTISLPAETSALNFESQVPYNIFLAYVTSMTTPAPALTPSPAPSPTYYATQPPPATPAPTLTPSACPSSTSGDDDGGEHDDAYRTRIVRNRHRGGDDDDGGSCSTASPEPAPTCTGDDDDGHHRHHSYGIRSSRGRHHGHDEDCEDDD